MATYHIPDFSIFKKILNLLKKMEKEYEFRLTKEEKNSLMFIKHDLSQMASRMAEEWLLTMKYKKDPKLVF